jgi:hypothetical protein
VLKSNAAEIVYTPRPDATPKAEVDALATVYRYLLLEKGGSADLTADPTTKAVKNGPRKTDKEQT